MIHDQCPLPLFAGYYFNLTGVKNPIKIASGLLSQQRNGLMSLGRIPPM